MNHAAQLLDDPQVQARASIVNVGNTPVPASPVRIVVDGVASSGTDTSEPQIVGQDTAEVLAAAGFSDDEILALAETGVT